MSSSRMEIGGARNVTTYGQWVQYYKISDDRFVKLFKEKMLTDVTFVIGLKAERISAHKVALSACCWNFYIAFYLLKLDTNVFVIHDVTAQSFRIFLEFCYKREVNLDSSMEPRQVWDTLKLACRFGIIRLIMNCESWLCGKLTDENYFNFYTADTFLRKNSPLKRQILGIVEKKFAEIPHASETNEGLMNFTKISLKKLTDLAASQTLKFDEMHLFSIMMLWAKNKCVETKRPIIPKNLRDVLGEAFEEIRFPIMTTKWLRDIMAQYPGLLTRVEILRIGKFMTKEADSCPGFKHHLRDVGFAHLLDPQTLWKDEKDNKVRISCFDLPPQRTNIVSRELAVFFKFQSTDKVRRTFRGFGFFSTSKFETQLESGYLQRIDGEGRYTDLKFTDSGMPSTLISWDFSYCEYLFRNVKKLVPNEWHVLYCKFVEDVPILHTSSPISSREYDSEGTVRIFFTKKDPNIHVIPYLFFD